MISFKATGPGTRLSQGVTLRRMSWLMRTVRYEWSGVDDYGKTVTTYSPTFEATLQEWERAHD